MCSNRGGEHLTFEYEKRKKNEKKFRRRNHLVCFTPLRIIIYFFFPFKCDIFYAFPSEAFGNYLSMETGLK